LPPRESTYEVGAGGLGRLQHVPAGVALQDVVAVEEDDVRAACLRDAVVARGPAPAAVLREPESPYATGMLGGQPLGHLVRTVRAAVVHDHDLDVPQRLLQHGAYGRRQAGRVVVDDHDDRYVRHADGNAGWLAQIHVHPINPKCYGSARLRGVVRSWATWVDGLETARVA
jgi:hypothetical protein